MAIKTHTIAQIRRLLDGLPDDQDAILIDSDGTAAEINGIDLQTVRDVATGREVLTIEFDTNRDRWFGFDPATGEIDSSE